MRLSPCYFPHCLGGCFIPNHVGLGLFASREDDAAFLRLYRLAGHV